MYSYKMNLKNNKPFHISLAIHFLMMYLDYFKIIDFSPIQLMIPFIVFIGTTLFAFSLAMILNFFNKKK